MSKSSFYQLFSANYKMMFRNYRGVFFNLVLPIFLYIAISKIAGIVPGANEENTYASFLLPGIIAMTVMQTGIFSVAYWLIDLRARGSLKRFLVTPLSPLQMVGAVVASRLVLILAQVVMLTALGVWLFNVHLQGSIIGAVILLLLGGAVFLNIGFLISNLANNYEEAAPITTVVNLTFTFLGNIFFSTESFPEALRIISEILPVTHMSEGIRNILVKSWSFVDVLPQIGGLLIWLALLLLLNSYFFKKKEE